MSFKEFREYLSWYEHAAEVVISYYLLFILSLGLLGVHP